MMGKSAAATFTLLGALWLCPAGAQGSEYCYGLPGCEHDKVAVIRCETDSDGGVVVRNSSVTSATGVTVRRGDKCAATISVLLQAGLRIAFGPTVSASSAGTQTSLSFVFLSGYIDDDSDDDSDDDDRDDD